MVVGTAYLVAFHMRELALDVVGIKAVLIENGGGGMAEAVASGAVVVAHAVKGVEHGVFAHVLDRLV